MLDHMALSREFYAFFVDLPTSMAELGDFEIPFTQLTTERAITEKSLVRHVLGI